MNPTSPPAPSAPPPGKTLMAVDAKGQPAHGYDVERVATPLGFRWWVRGVRFPVEHVNEKTKQIHVSGKPRKWRVAGPFLSEAIAEKCIDPKARVP